MKQGWQILTIGSVAKVFNGNSINAEVKKAKYEGLEEGYPFIATKDVGVNGEVDYDNGVKIPFDTDFKIAMPDAVFVCAEGGSAGKKVAHIDRKVCFGNKLFALQPVKEKVKGGFLYYAVQEAGFKAQFRLSMAGIIGGVSAKKFNSITIPIPPLSEQQRIVALLDAEFAKIDILKANAEKNLQNAKDLFQAALKKELEPKEGWKSMLLGNFAKMKAGDFIKASDIHSDYYEGSFPCYGGNGLRGYVDVPNKEGEYCLIGRQGALCGNIHIANGVFRATEHAVVVEPYFSMPIKLVYYLLSALNLNKYSTGAAQPGLSVKNIAEKAMISIPPEEKHSIIAATLDGLSVRTQALQANYEKTLCLCDDLKHALLRKAFNGEL